jgi:enoyl-CoA hydratase
LRLIKDTVNKAVDYSVYDAMQAERKNFYLLFASEDQKEGMKAFVEKRPPNFKGK